MKEEKTLLMTKRESVLRLMLEKYIKDSL